MKNFISVLTSIVKRYPHIILGVLLFLVPNLFWGKLYDLGGDDSRLYYLFPWEFITRFAKNVVVDNTLGLKSLYVSQAYFIPFFSIIALVKYVLPFVHIQHFFLGLNLLFGFVFFYNLISLLIPTDKNELTNIKIIASLAYILSQFLIKTIYSHQLLAIYLVSVVPVVLYYFVLSLETKKITHIYIAAIIYSIFSTGMNTFPWFLGYLITLIPLFIYICIRYKTRFFIHGFILLFTIIGLNFYWLIHQIYPIVVHSRGSLNGSVNVNFLEDTANLVWSLSRLNSPLNVFFSTVRSSWSEFTSFTTSYLINGSYFFIILIAGIVMGRNYKYKNLFIATLASLLISFFLLAPNFGSWSVALFIFFTKHIPLFTIFRNMFDKFSMGVAFNYSLLLALSLSILANHVTIKKYINIILVGILILLFSNSITFIFPIYNDARYSTRISGKFNADYMDLVNYIRSMNTTERFMWLPMNLANYVYVSDTDLNHYYFGPSPLLLLSGAADYTGVLSFGTAFDHSIAYQLQKNLADKDYDVIGRFYRENNVGYIILLTEPLSSTRKKYLFDRDLFEKQNEEFKNTVLGEKIKDFGDRYSLYAINNKYKGKKILLTDTKESTEDNSSGITFTKVNSSTFDIKLPEFQGIKYLVFKETYNDGWKLFSFNNSKDQLPVINNEVRNNANIYMLDGNVYSNKYIRLFFVPERYTVIGVAISVSTVIGITLAFCIGVLKRKKI